MIELFKMTKLENKISTYIGPAEDNTAVNGANQS